jgi:hypothetical protein
MNDNAAHKNVAGMQSGTNTQLFCWQLGNLCIAYSGDQMTRMLARECQKRAFECEEMAEQQDDPERRREYAELATIWRVLAKESEETEVV